VSSQREQLQWYLHNVHGENSFGCSAANNWRFAPGFADFYSLKKGGKLLVPNWRMNVSVRSWQDPYILSQLLVQPDSLDKLSADDFLVLAVCLLVIAAVLSFQPVSVAMFLRRRHLEEAHFSPPAWEASSSEMREHTFDNAVPGHSRSPELSPTAKRSSVEANFGGMSTEELAYARVRALQSA
jgi:hypothetical protein